MEAIFRECARVLHPDGVLTVMFTHKRAFVAHQLKAANVEAAVPANGGAGVRRSKVNANLHCLVHYLLDICRSCRQLLADGLATYSPPLATRSRYALTGARGARTIRLAARIDAASPIPAHSARLYVPRASKLRLKMIGPSALPATPAACTNPLIAP
jgi:hypothetical protein